MPDWKCLDITENEFLVYECLLKNGASTISYIAHKTKLDQRSSYDYIERLINKGLVGEIIHNNKRMFLGLNPEMLDHYIDEHRKRTEDEFDFLDNLLKENRRDISLNIINSKKELLKFVKNIASDLDKGLNKSNKRKPIIYFANNYERLFHEPSFRLFFNTKKPSKIRLNNPSETIMIFYRALFLIYSIPEEKGFFIDDNLFSENMKAYFDD
jgi:sugar-specific transcriptional regulator TrmB